MTMDAIALAAFLLLLFVTGLVIGTDSRDAMDAEHQHANTWW